MALTQSVKDAEADAETLRMVALTSTNPRRHLLRGTSIVVENLVYHSSLKAVRDGDKHPEWSAEEATLAARAAFRAVPGLRGDQ